VKTKNKEAVMSKKITVQASKRSLYICTVNDCHLLVI